MNMNIFQTFVMAKHVMHNFPKRLYNVKCKPHEVAETTWDIVISGGGMVGSALACSLGSSKVLSNKKILLLESSPETKFVYDPNKFSNRVCALNKNTRSLFDSFNAWKKICSYRMKEVKKMCIWESLSDARITFQVNDINDDIAYIVENDIILNSLYSVIDELQPRINVLYGVKATNYTFPSNKSDTVSIHLGNDITLKTKLLIGADGINSLVRKIMNVNYVSWKYEQKGIVATLKLSEPTENVIAWQRFLSSGPIALLPLSDEICSLVWTVSIPMSKKLLNSSDEEFVDALNLALWDESYKNSTVESALSYVKNILPSFFSDSEIVRQLPPSVISVEPNSRAAFPLGLGHSTEYVAARVALVGDSAHRVHPLAGQGVNLGFGDVKCLTEKLEDAVYNGDCVGNITYLLNYEEERQRQVIAMMALTDVLNRLYQIKFTPIVLMRSLGVTVLDSLNSVKERIIQQASS